MKPIVKLSLAKVELPDWEKQSRYIKHYDYINNNQVRYKPRSTINQTGAATPVALAPLMDEALEKLEHKVGNIDEWVALQLQWTVQEMAMYLTSEQIDAVALAISSMNDKEGFLIADATGFGKGRIGAAIARFSILNNRVVIFLTEKANLFSDFWRDVRDINSDELFGKPFLLNSSSKIIDTTSSEGNILFSSLKKSLVDKVIENGLDTDTKIVMATYSQFNRQGRKVAFLESISHNAHLMMDEGHNQAGDSSTSKNMAPALFNSASSTYLTATAGRDITNLRTYTTVFPWLSMVGDITQISPGHKRALAEASVREGCALGRIVRREHDLSNMVLNLIEDTKNLEINKVLADALAPILSKMARLGDRVFATIEGRNQEAKENKINEFWSLSNFGSGLNNLMGQFLIALKIDLCVELVIDDIKNGYKPVIVIENTMESLMRELSMDPDENRSENENEDDDADYPVDDTEEVVVDKPVPTYGEALRIMALRLLRVSVRRGGPDGEKEVLELDDERMIEMRNEIVEMTKGFPSISLSPIDDIRSRIEDAGRLLYERKEIPEPWKIDEISARSLRVVNGQYVKMENKDRTVTVAQFVNGKSHGLVLTSAASTGISLHDGVNFKHHAPRRLYELGVLKNVIKRIQMFGRVLRRGQLSEPEFFILSSGLDSEVFNLAVQNRKVQDLSASVSGNASAGLVVAAQDYEDITGNEIAYDLLMENPKLADAMGISLRVPKEEGNKTLYWIAKLVRRLLLVAEKDRSFLYKALTSTYEERIKHGTSNIKDGVLPGVWRVTDRKLFHKGDNTNSPLTGKDIYVTDIEQDCTADPIRAKEMAWMVNHATETFKSRLGDIPSRLRRETPSILESMLTRRFKSVKIALADKDENPVKRMSDTLKKVTWASEKIKPGATGVLPGEDGEPTPCMVIDCRFPSSEKDIFSPRQWTVSYAIPGESELRVCTLDIILNNPAYSFGDRSNGRDMLTLFDNYKAGPSLIKKRIVDGSLLGSITTCIRLKSGNRMSFKDEWGISHEGMVLPKSSFSRIIGLPGIASTAESALAVIDAGGRLISEQDDMQSGIEIRPYKESKFLVSFPSARKFNHITEYDLILKATGELHSYGQRKEAIASVNMLPDLINALTKKGILLQYEAEYRDIVLKSNDNVIEKNIENFNEVSYSR